MILLLLKFKAIADAARNRRTARKTLPRATPISEPVICAIRRAQRICNNRALRKPDRPPKNSVTDKFIA